MENLLKDGPPMPSATAPDTTKINKYLDAVSAKAGEMNPKLAGCINAMQPAVLLVIQMVACVVPFYLWAVQWVFKIYNALPTNVLMAVFGVALCFFGGTYVASIAAIEAFRQLGWTKLYANIQVIAEQVQKVGKANAKDDVEDKDGDGIADVEQISANQLAQRKLMLAMREITEPTRLQESVGALWTAYIGVLATLRLEFARTTAFALGIVEIVKYPAVRWLSPLLIAVLGKEMSADGAKKWAVTIVESGLTIFAVIFAWYLQMIISAFYSGLRGGRMFADAICQILVDKGWMEKMPFVSQPFKPEDSYLDEVILYTMAALGFSFQFFQGFQLPFPLNIVFLPLSIIEWFLRIQISMTDTVVH